MVVPPVIIHFERWEFPFVNHPCSATPHGHGVSPIWLEAAGFYVEISRSHWGPRSQLRLRPWFFPIEGHNPAWYFLHLPHNYEVIMSPLSRDNDMTPYIYIYLYIYKYIYIYIYMYIYIFSEQSPHDWFMFSGFPKKISGFSH